MSTVAHWFFGQSATEALFPPEKGKLHIVGEHFYTEENQLWQWRGYSWFLGYRRFCNGEDVTPDLRWLRAHGFNLVRVFGPLPWKETPDYDYAHFQLDVLGAFFQLLAEHGLRCEFVPGCYRFDGWAAFLQQCYDIAQYHNLVIIERVNEPFVGEKPDPLVTVDMHGVISAYGIYPKPKQSYKDVKVLDYGTVHTPRDAAWHRKARIAQEIQHSKGQPWISDEPAKAIEDDFQYPGGKRNPDEFVWHHGIAGMYCAGSTLHTECGKWGTTPTEGMRQYEIVKAVRDQVFLKIGPEWQAGTYSGSHMGNSPVHFEHNVWAYSSLLDNRAVSVRVKTEPSQAVNGWRISERWGPGNSLAILER